MSDTDEDLCPYCDREADETCRCEDGPENPCGFCGMREAAPGLTACNYCA